MEKLKTKLTKKFEELYPSKNEEIFMKCSKESTKIFERQRPMHPKMKALVESEFFINLGKLDEDPSKYLESDYHKNLLMNLTH